MDRKIRQRVGTIPAIISRLTACFDDAILGATGYATGSSANLLPNHLVDSVQNDDVKMMTSRRSTMSDVAKRAGVSKTTVSHVINNTRVVEPETRARVIAAVHELDYRPNEVARSLSTNRTGTIGMVISDARNHFFGELLVGAEEILRPNKFGLIVCNTDEVLDRESDYLDLLLGQRVEGIIAAATSQQWVGLAKAEARDTPIVFVDRAFADMNGLYVGADNRGGALMGTRYLLERNYTRIGLLSGLQRLSTMRARKAGYCTALEEAGIPLRQGWIMESRLSIEAGKEAALKMLTSDRPDALFVNNNLLVLGTLLALKELGLCCPDDIAIVAFDDHPWAAVCDPPLTVVRQPSREMGRRAAQMLCALISGQPVEQRRTVLECELIIRNSA